MNRYDDKKAVVASSGCTYVFQQIARSNPGVGFFSISFHS
jgi:hypothetical protein